ncbi:eukaryotic translation initiation factor 5A-1 [Aplysia californica]|uniref:Eukaryotic translation initiation factor 5A n=1 Tax=Aplysia californica TaxID=6500 RepID=A0ABM0JC64_APLCA|nr:eukaryotic translation initiation factor 5A-1 [Aplysia californica]
MQDQNNACHKDDDFDRGDAGASLSFPLQCSALRKGGFVNIKQRPCKIVDLHSFKVGKHGHAKVSITGLDVFTEKRFQIVHPSSHSLDVPVVTRTDYLLVDIGQYMSLMDDKGHLRADLKAPDDEHGQLMRDKIAGNTDESILVTVLSAMGEEIVVGVKTDKN